MAELHVRSLPPEVHPWLRQRAQAQGRSMSAEAVSIRRRVHLGADARLAEELIREDRERSG